MSQLSPNATTCNVVDGIEIRAELNKNALSHAIDMRRSRHEALRTAFVQSSNGSEDDEDRLPKQVILKDSPLRLETVEASSSFEVDGHFYRLHDAVYNLETGELIKMMLVSLSPHVHHLLIGYHHINMDSASMTILIDENVAAIRRPDPSTTPASAGRLCTSPAQTARTRTPG